MANLPDFESEPDERLARHAEDGQEAAFRVLLGRHLQPLRTYLALRAPVADLIDEVAHDAFVFAYRHLADFTHGSMQAWLRSIAHHQLRDRLKAHARESVKHERYGEHVRWELALAQMDAPVASEEADHLARCVEKLRLSQRELLTLRYEQELSSEEIAQRTGRSTLGVRTVLMRIRQQLRQCIETQMEGVTP